jgi:hypothetical protein
VSGDPTVTAPHRPRFAAHRVGRRPTLEPGFARRP